MKKRYIAPVVALAAAGVGATWSGNVALANDTNIEARVVCVENGQSMIEFTSTSWDDDEDGENARIDILFDDVVVYSGAYVLPTNSFAGLAPIPVGKGPGDTVEVTALAVGDWGNGNDGGQDSNVVVTIPEQVCAVDTALGRFTGGGHQLRVGDARVTRGLTVHCDLLLSNNLEVNWGGNRFHMTEHLETVACTDDPDIHEEPPPAPLDTLIGVGTGRYNGTAGYTIEFTLVDAGEPGDADMAALLIYRTADPTDVVLNIPLQLLSGGNLQAHYDQPHG
jgi:hypothetical protein